MYNDPLRPGTEICHYYTREWAKMGYRVIVINLRSMFPAIYTTVAGLFPKLAHWYIGNHVEMDRNMNTVYHEVEGIPVYSMPIFKYIPHGKYPKRSIYKTVDSICGIIAKEGMVPDAIIGHFYNPTMEVVYELKKRFERAKSCIVFHEGDPNVVLKNYKKNLHEILDSYNLVGFRHQAMKEKYEALLGKLPNTFICYSGTSQTYLESPPIDKYFTDSELSSFLYVGQFTTNKSVLSILEALNKEYPQKTFKLDLVGSGGTCLETLKNYVIDNHLEDSVNFVGQIKRNDIIKYYDESQCFAMISISEAFGLVYLEAMARGCITIGTRGQGIDGVIEDGVNGFLCEGGNGDELATIIRKINNLPACEKQRLSNNARLTAERFSDYNVAKNYIEKVFNS